MNETLKSAITYGLFPTTFFSAILIAIYGLNEGWNEGFLVLGITVATILITSIFERISPQHVNWNVPKNDVKTDLLHGLFSMILLPQLLEAALRAVLLVGAIKLSSLIGFGLWPTQWPLIAQLAFAMLVSQFGEYWWHRMAHEVPILWRFHSVHHSPLRLYWLNAARFHPIDTAVSFTLSISVLLLLGASNEVLTLVTVWMAVHGLFQHCNVHMKLGFLNYIFSMAELHRWHHSLNLEEANTNYGNNIIFWDLVFGTYFNPSGKEASEHIGLTDLNEFPEDYIGQVLAPIKWKEIK